MHHTSASQVSTFLRCNRKWFWRYVMGIKTPSTEAQQRGTKIHKAVENYFKDGVFPNPPKEGERDLRPYVQAAISYVHKGEVLLPEPVPGPDRPYLVEHGFLIPTRPGLPPWLGFIDLFQDSKPVRRCPDFKTTGKLKYAKTPAELLEDPQMMSYAKWAYMSGHQGELEVGHFYIEVRTPPPKTVLPRVRYVPLRLVQDTVEQYWEDTAIPTVEKMLLLEKGPKDITLVTPNDEACSDYGGCEHRARCGLDKHVTTFGRKTKKATKGLEQMANPLLAKLKAKKAAAGGNGVAAAPPPAPPQPPQAPPPAPAPNPDAAEAAPKIPNFIQQKRVAAVPQTGVQPEDSAPRTTPVAAQTAAQTPAATPAAPKTRKASAKSAPKGAKGGFELYIDCQPVIGGKPAVPFESWWAPIEEAVGQLLAEQGEDPNIMRMDFGPQKATIADAVRANLDDVPSGLVVTTGNTYGKEALNVLIPHAARVVRAIR